jgi:hypothetical protein
LLLLLLLLLSLLLSAAAAAAAGECQRGPLEPLQLQQAFQKVAKQPPQGPEGMPLPGAVIDAF